MKAKPLPLIAIYQPHFLSISMTFIYRQLLGARDDFLPIVLAAKLNNQNLFPYPYVYSKKIGLLERAWSKAYSQLTGRMANMSSIRRRYWKKILLENKAALVHAHFGSSGLDILPVVRGLGLPFLVTFHGADASSYLENSMYVAKLRELFDYAHIVTVSKYMADQLIDIGADPERTVVHYIGAPMEDFKFVPRKPLKSKAQDGDVIQFLQVANFVEKKGHAYTLKAFRAFSNHYPRCKLILAGQGSLRDNIAGLCVELGIKDQVELVGPVSKPQVVQLMSDSDIFLHHSITAVDGDKEGIPTVLMEAMATGLVVVSTYHSGIPELITDGDNGFLVQERDVPAYTDRLVSTLTDADGVPERAFSTVDADFNQAKQNAALMQIYRGILAGHTTPHKHLLSGKRASATK
jgi:glycosyltransferase involved in cell wall biosynthesis